MVAARLRWLRWLRWLVALAALCAGLAGTSTAPAGQGGAASDDADLSCTAEGAVAGGATTGGKQRCGGSRGDGDSPDPKVRRIIHATALVAALADGGLAQLPGVGSAVVVPSIQAAMVGIIGSHYGCHMDAGTALAVVTWLASGHAKKAMFKEIIGYIPLAGNVVKAGITGFMTEGIGNLANGMLRCPEETEDLFKKANVGSESVQRATETARHLFHVVSDYLGNAGLSSISPEEAWHRARFAFSAKSQAELLLEIEDAPDASSLANIIRKHAWNLQVLTSALTALTQRFSEEWVACMVVDFVGESLWAPASADAEARSAVAPYLLACLPHATLETRRSVAVASARLLIQTRGGSNRGLSPLAVQQTLELVASTAEEPGAGVVRDTDVADDGLAAAQPVLALSDIVSAFSAAMIALQRGQWAACGALRALIRAEGSAAITMGAGRNSALAQVRHLELLNRMEIPSGAELCMPSLRLDLTGLLLLDAPPANIERPVGKALQDIGATRRTSGGRGQLEDALGAAVVGQRCAIERLTKQPGFARLKMRGLWAEKPLVLLLTGPSGTGKTLMARTLAQELLGRPIVELEATGRFRTFHMNVFSLVEDQKSFFGPPKGIMGVGDLPELLKTHPDAVILLDECEKAHPSFARALLKVFGEHGAVYDPHTGRDISSVNATFILTSNLAKDLIFEHTTVATKSADSDFDCTAYGALRNDVLDALRLPLIRGRDNFFRESEVRGRLTDVLPFLPFGISEVETAVRRFLASESEIFQRSPEFLHATLLWEPQVVSFLASEYTRRPEEGLRGVHTQLQAKVREVFEYAIEAGLLQRSGEVVLRVRSAPPPASLDLRVLPPRPAQPPSPKPPSSPDSASSDEAPEASSWWPLDMSGSSAWKLPVAMSWESSSTAAGSSTEREWERIRDWDWDLFWQQLREFLWDYWPVLLVVTIALVAIVATPPVAVATSVPFVAAAAAPAASAPAAAAAAAAGAGVISATPWLASILAGLQLVVPIGTTAVTAWSAAYVWQNRRVIAAIAATAGLTTLMLPTLLRFLSRWMYRRFFSHEGDELRRIKSPPKRKRDRPKESKVLGPKEARALERALRQVASPVKLCKGSPVASEPHPESSIQKPAINGDIACEPAAPLLHFIDEVAPQATSGEGEVRRNASGGVADAEAASGEREPGLNASVDAAAEEEAAIGEGEPRLNASVGAVAAEEEARLGIASLACAEAEAGGDNVC